MRDARGVTRPRASGKASGGYQNRTSYVSCATGDFVLRVYTNVSDPSRQRFEHELLRRLGAAGLPFAIPHPVPSTSGDTLRVVDGRLAALFVRIAGEPASEDDPVARRRGAAALADVDPALGALGRFEVTVPSFTRALAAMHPPRGDLGAAV